MVTLAMKQFVYQIKANNLPELKNRSDVKFIALKNAYDAFKYMHVLIKRFGYSSTLIKTVIKLILKRNVLYTVIYNKRIVSDGLANFGLCNFYAIEKNDCVIGPVWTDSSYRGKGFATFGLLNLLHFISNNTTVNSIYIDTSEDNIAMQSVITKLDFLLSEKTYLRVDK